MPQYEMDVCRIPIMIVSATLTCSVLKRTIFRVHQTQTRLCMNTWQSDAASGESVATMCSGLSWCMVSCSAVRSHRFHNSWESATQPHNQIVGYLSSHLVTNQRCYWGSVTTTGSNRLERVQREFAAVSNSAT
jgi:hypothetical protein